MPEPLVYGLNTLRIEMLRHPPRLMLATLGILLGLGPAAGVAETEWARLNVYGMPGHVEMPSAFRLPDAEAGLSVVSAQHQSSVALTFQLTGRLSASFRYARLPGYGDLYDRSFDLHYTLMEEGVWRPALGVGLRDFIGTSVLSSEYLVASKTLGSNVSFSAGLGWGRLGSYNSFANPFGLDDRSVDVGLGGKPSVSHWFHGPAAAFAGVSWQPTERLRFDVEYSSDAHQREVERGAIDRRSPINIGVSYEPRPGLHLSARALHGSELSLGATILFNPKRPLSGGDRSPAPAPVRPARSAPVAVPLPALTVATARAFEKEGLALVALQTRGNTAFVEVQPTNYRNGAQAIGRAARQLSALLPKDIDTIVVHLSERGLSPAEVTLSRADLEATEYAGDPALALRERTGITSATPPQDDAQRLPPAPVFALRPYLSTEVFDPDNPLRAEVGVRASAELSLGPNLSLGAALRSEVFGNKDSSLRLSNSPLPHVRSDANLYAKDTTTGVEYLTLDYFHHIAPDLFGRVSAGYLEPMFAGVSAELLWWPATSRFAVGVEVNQAWQRDRDGLFGLGQYDYDVTTGHVSFYYASPTGFDYQLDIGRYLAGDLGATFLVERSFENGWRIGAFATLTDVPFDTFGEGSFDKGIRLTIPLDWVTGRPSRDVADLTIRPIQRDGGARLSIRNRLHAALRDVHGREIAEDWGSFWR